MRPETAGRAPGDVGTLESEIELATQTSKDELQRRFTELLGANGPALGRLAASYTRSVGDRDDLFQEIALAIWRALPRFRGECSERTFIFRAVSYERKRRGAQAELKSLLAIQQQFAETPDSTEVQ